MISTQRAATVCPTASRCPARTPRWMRWPRARSPRRKPSCTRCSARRSAKFSPCRSGLGAGEAKREGDFMKNVVDLLLSMVLAAITTLSVAATAEKPSLNVKTLDGATFELGKQSGKWVIVNFWATWCSPCLKELPDISAFVSAHKDKVAAIGLDFEDAEKGEIKQFLNKHPLSYPVAQVDIDHPPADFDAPKGLPN